MNAKRKVIIAILSCAIVVLVGVIAVVAVLAATSVNAQSTIKVKFVAEKQVNATVVFEHATVDETGTIDWSSVSDTTLTFNNATTATQGFAEIDHYSTSTLSTKNFLVLKFTITNNGGTDYADTIKANVTLNPTTNSGVSIRYASSEPTYTRSAVGSLSNSSSQLTMSTTSSPSQTYYSVIYATAEATSGEFVGTFNWTLEK